MMKKNKLTFVLLPLVLSACMNGGNSASAEAEQKEAAPKAAPATTKAGASNTDAADTTGKTVQVAQAATSATGSAPKASASAEVSQVPASNHPGFKVYQAACMSCHVAEGKPTVAPPIFAVKNHVILKYAEREAFVERIKTWVKAPNADDALMRGAIGKFGLMPAMAHMSDEDLQAVAEYLYDTDLSMPDWYKEHYKAEHGELPKTN